MASSRVVSFEMESRQNDPDDNEHEIQTLRFKNELKHSLDDDDEDTTSSIVSDYTGDGATKHFDITSPGTNLPQQDVPSNKISIEKSSDILIGSKTQFNGNVVIQNFIAGNDGQNSIIPNHNPDSLQEPQNAQQTSDSSWYRSLRAYIPCKSKWIFIILVLLCLLSVLGGLAVAAYFLYLHFGVYKVAGALFVCKTNDTTVCYIGSSTRSCSNIVSADGRPYISGHTTTGLCKIFSKKGCLGNLQEIETDHVQFYFNASSARC